jgi:hypothetical protein
MKGIISWYFILTFILVYLYILAQMKDNIANRRWLNAGLAAALAVVFAPIVYLFIFFYVPVLLGMH